MTSQQKSRWADDDEDAALEDHRKREKEAKKRAKAERQRNLEASEAARQQELSASTEQTPAEQSFANGESDRPSKRRKITPEPEPHNQASAKLLQFPAPAWGPCRHVENFEKLNHIEEGSYGWVSRAKEIATGEIVALKKLKMDNANDGFPVTGLREIQTLKASKHANIVALREVTMGDKLDE